MFFCSFVRSGLRGSDPNGVVKVVGLGTDHRLSLAQNPVLLAGQIAILLASSNRDASRDGAAAAATLAIAQTNNNSNFSADFMMIAFHILAASCQNNSLMGAKRPARTYWVGGNLRGAHQTGGRSTNQ